MLLREPPFFRSLKVISCRPLAYHSHEIIQLDKTKASYMRWKRWRLRVSTLYWVISDKERQPRLCFFLVSIRCLVVFFFQLRCVEDGGTRFALRPRVIAFSVVLGTGYANATLSGRVSADLPRPPQVADTLLTSKNVRSLWC
jgi:hypothetical protein